MLLATPLQLHDVRKRIVWGQMVGRNLMIVGTAAIVIHRERTSATNKVRVGSRPTCLPVRVVAARSHDKAVA